MAGKGKGKRPNRKKAAQPAKQAVEPGVSPLTGVAPPAEFQWKPGQSGNPAGRPPAGASVREWINVMQDWTITRLGDVIKSPESPANQIAAAQVWMGAVLHDGGDFDRIMDRTEGKPHQSSTVKVEDSKGDAVHGMMADLIDDPEALAAAQLLAKKLDAKHEKADGG